MHRYYWQWMLAPVAVLVAFFLGMLLNNYLGGFERDAMQELIERFNQQYRVVQGRFNFQGQQTAYRFISVDGGKTWLEQDGDVWLRTVSRWPDGASPGSPGWGWNQERLDIWDKHFSKTERLMDVKAVTNESLLRVALARERAIKSAIEVVGNRNQASALLENGYYCGYLEGQLPVPVQIVELSLPDKPESTEPEPEIMIAPATGVEGMDNQRLLTTFMEANSNAPTGQPDPSH